jgi:4-hydroxy-2-oxoheptanedioate aldolase
MNGADLKAKTRAGGIVYGTMLSAARNPRWATTIAGLGLDYVIIDSEHAPRGRSEIADLLAGLTSVDVVPIVRVPIPSSHYITMALDAGAQGILAPYCETPDEVREVVGAAKWRPLKGELVRRVVEQGEFPSDASREYLERRNRNSVCIVGIESVPAMEALDDIVAIEGVDAIFVGPNDLSISLGVPDQYDHPDYEAALRTIIATCQGRNVPVLIHHQTPDLSAKWLREGARFVLHCTETRAVHNAFREEFGAIRAVGEEIGGGAAGDVGESDETI